MTTTRSAASRGPVAGGGRLRCMETDVTATHLAAHTKVGGALVDPDRLTPRDFDLEGEAREIWRQVTEDHAALARLSKSPVGHIIYRLRRANERSCPLTLIGRLVVWAANARIPEAKLRLLSFWIDSVIDRCFAGSAHRTMAEIDQDEHRLESRETALTIERLTAEASGCARTAEQLEEEARVNEEEAALQLERARLLRRRARSLQLAMSRGLP